MASSDLFAEFRNRPGPSQRKRPYTRLAEPSTSFQSSSTMVKAVRGNTDKSDSQSKDSLSKYSQSKDYVIDEGKKLIVGSVEQVVSWCRTLSFLDSSKIIYQVYGIMDSVKTGTHKCEKIFCLHSVHKKSGIICLFYEIDRPIPSIPKGTLVLCTGHVKGKNKLQIFTIKELSEDDKNSFNRISLVSQWAINDILLYKK